MNYKVSLSLSFSSKLKPDYHKCLLMTFGRHIHLYIYTDKFSFLYLIYWYQIFAGVHEI